MYTTIHLTKARWVLPGPAVQVAWHLGESAGAGPAAAAGGGAAVPERGPEAPAAGGGGHSCPLVMSK